MNRKGIAAKTLGELIIVIAGGIIILTLVFAMMGALSPALAGFGCGLNIRLFSAMVSNSKGLVGVPILLCNQYREPVQINAANFKACPELADFCEKSKGSARDECYKQCARIQIDKLVDSCWTMGGKGKLSLKGPWWEKLGTGEIAGEIATKVTSYVGAVAWESLELEKLETASLLHPVVYYLITGKTPPLEIAIVENIKGRANIIEKAIRDLTGQTKANILKCYRFQVIHPARTYSGEPFIFNDTLGGWSQYHTLSEEQCHKLGQKYPCFLGGSGVQAFQPENIDSDSFLYDTYKLNYEIEEPRQICYISYVEYENKHGNTRYAVIRSCKGWNPYGGNQKFLN